MHPSATWSLAASVFFSNQRPPPKAAVGQRCPGHAESRSPGSPSLQHLRCGHHVCGAKVASMQDMQPRNAVCRIVWLGLSAHPLRLCCMDPLVVWQVSLSAAGIFVGKSVRSSREETCSQQQPLQGPAWLQEHWGLTSPRLVGCLHSSTGSVRISGVDVHISRMACWANARAASRRGVCKDVLPEFDAWLCSANAHKAGAVASMQQEGTHLQTSIPVKTHAVPLLPPRLSRVVHMCALKIH